MAGDRDGARLARERRLGVVAGALEQTLGIGGLHDHDVEVGRCDCQPADSLTPLGLAGETIGRAADLAAIEGTTGGRAELALQALQLLAGLAVAKLAPDGRDGLSPSQRDPTSSSRTSPAVRSAVEAIPAIRLMSRRPVGRRGCRLALPVGCGAR